MTTVNLDWREIQQQVKWLNASAMIGTPSDPPIEVVLQHDFGIDVRDPRQLHRLMTCVDVAASCLVKVSLQAWKIEAFGMSEQESKRVSRAVAEALVVLILELSEFLPPLVKNDKVKREWIDRTDIDPLVFNWKNVAPKQWEQRMHAAWAAGADSNPARIAYVDQANALVRDHLTDGLIAFMTMAAIYLVSYSAQQIVDDSGPLPAASTIGALFHVLCWNLLPEEFQRLAA